MIANGGASVKKVFSLARIYFYNFGCHVTADLMTIFRTTKSDILWVFLCSLGWVKGSWWKTKPIWWSCVMWSWSHVFCWCLKWSLVLLDVLWRANGLRDSEQLLDDSQDTCYRVLNCVFALVENQDCLHSVWLYRNWDRFVEDHYAYHLMLAVKPARKSFEGFNHKPDVCWESIFTACIYCWCICPEHMWLPGYGASSILHSHAFKQFLGNSLDFSGLYQDIVDLARSFLHIVGYVAWWF